MSVRVVSVAPRTPAVRVPHVVRYPGNIEIRGLYRGNIMYTHKTFAESPDRLYATNRTLAGHRVHTNEWCFVSENLLETSLETEVCVM